VNGLTTPVNSIFPVGEWSGQDISVENGCDEFGACGIKEKKPLEAL
jgi:hypothetical protein